MSDWRKELGGILEGRARASRAEQENALFEAFLRQVATPSLRELADELIQHKRDAQVREAPAAILLSVRNGDVEEIAFRIIKRPAATGVLPYAEVRLRKGLRLVKVESFLREPTVPSYGLDDVTKDDIIRCFLKHYRMVLDSEPNPSSVAPAT
ncbi:MAG: hypothetical protein PHR35_06650 [Kiritimatiellae bacterium]|nr:hypothetical protein [Kiritimatiellia bacterium]